MLIVLANKKKIVPEFCQVLAHQYRGKHRGKGIKGNIAGKEIKIV